MIAKFWTDSWLFILLAGILLQKRDDSKLEVISVDKLQR